MIRKGKQDLINIVFDSFYAGFERLNTPIVIPEEMGEINMCEALKEIIEDEKREIENEKREIEGEKNALERKNAERVIRVVEKNLHAGRSWSEITEITEITPEDYRSAKEFLKL